MSETEADRAAEPAPGAEPGPQPGRDEGPRRPGTVLAAAVICFAEAGVCGVFVLVGVVIAVLGAEAHGAGTDAGLLITAGVVASAVSLALGVLYVLCGRGLLRGDRVWYLAGLALLSLTVVLGVIGFAVQRNLWDLLWPLIDVVAIWLLVGTPRSRAFFLGPRSGGPAGILRP